MHKYFIAIPYKSFSVSELLNIVDKQLNNPNN